MARVKLFNLGNLGRNFIKLACTGMAVVFISTTPYVVRAENITTSQKTYEVTMESAKEQQEAYASVFDATYYAENNADIVAVYGNDADSLLWHFLNYGMAEGRKGNAVFDVNFYKNTYGDLNEVYGDNLKLYYMHYLNFGQAEGRQGSSSSTSTSVYNGVDYAAVYDKETYRKLNPDVDAAFGDDTQALISHFVNYGIAEGRQANTDFNVVKYKYSLYNEDLRAAYGADMRLYYLHYINFGKSEGRNLQSGYEGVFDAKYYLEHNKDVYNNIVSRFTADGNTEGWALWHFVEYGMDEGRQANDSFNVQNYESKYADVKSAFGNNLKACYLHYLNNGINEGRNSVITPIKESGENKELEDALMAYFPNSNQFNTFTMDNGDVHDLKDLKDDYISTCNFWAYNNFDMFLIKLHFTDNVGKHYEYRVDGADGNATVHEGDVYMDKDTFWIAQYTISSNINSQGYIAGTTSKEIAKSFYDSYINNSKQNLCDDTPSTYVYVKAMYDCKTDQTQIYFVHGDVRRRIKVQETSTNKETTYYVNK